MKKTYLNMMRNYLTIRYDPKEKPLFKKAVWKDFVPKYSDPDGVVTENLLIKSIQKHLSNNKEPIALSLSSGIDSTLTLGLLRKSLPDVDITGICAVFEGGYDESKRAKIIAKKFDAKFNIVKIDSIFKNMSELISIAEKPRWNTYQHYVAKEAKKGSSILVNGDGADEIFSGYTFRYHKFLSNVSPDSDWVSRTKSYLDCHNRDWVPDQKSIFDKSIKFNWDDIYEHFKSYFSNQLNPLEQVMLADYNGKLIFDFIPTAQKIFKHYGLKGFSIYMDKNLIDFALHIPIDEKFDKKNQRGKLTLRKITKRLGIDHIDEKKGFSPDLLIDWQRYGKQICERILLDSDIEIYKRKIINRAWVDRALDRIDTDGDIRYLNRIVSILALEFYIGIFMTKKLL